MKHLSLFRGGDASSQLGYGTTSMMGTSSGKEQLDLLSAAMDSGITHFDTAPYYGYGEAERILGRFAEGRRDQITITSKYGITPSPLASSSGVRRLAKALISVCPPLRTIVRKRQSSLAHRANFSVEEAQASLDRSLRSLRTDYIDLFLLHEPLLEDAASDDLHAFLELEKTRGRILAYGCGGARKDLAQISSADLPTGKWLQFEDNILLPEFQLPPDVNRITFGPFNSALGQLTKALKNQPKVATEWSKQLGFDCADPSQLASMLQFHCHVRNPEGIVLFSTSSKKRIRSASNFLADDSPFSEQQLVLFLKLIRDLNLSV
ncbi:MAG: aldo/keto reductase [Verrucomicrobiales bacterium]